MSSSITAGGITHARLNGSLTFYAPNETPMRRQYAALFCITDTASDNSLNEMQFVYYYLEGGTHRTRVWRNRAGSGSRACFSAWVDGGLTISLLEAHFRSDRFGERVCYYGTPYLPFWVPATDSCH